MYQDIIHFWFDEIEPSQWWVKSEAFDRELKVRFGKVLQQAAAGELSDWRKAPEGRLAEVIVLDQFSRNIYRDTPQAFAQDSLALALAQEAVLGGHDRVLTPVQRSFLYMPFMHSESKTVQTWSEALFKANGLENNYRFALKHKEIIDQFGRYPHRNAILGRESTEQELEFLKQPGSSF